MAQPEVPVLPYSFQSELGSTFGTHLDADFDELVTSVTQIISNLAQIQRDDGAIRNQTVHSNAFTSDALLLMAGAGSPGDVDWRPMGSWVTATLYEVGNIVETGSPAVAYACSVQHVSGVFATDYAAGKWVVVSSPRTLVSADITGALGYTPVDVAGDTMTGPLVLVTGSQFGTSNPLTLSDALLASQDLVTLDKGLYVTYDADFANYAYGFAANVVRSASNNTTVGIQASTLTTSGSTGIGFGANFNAIGLSGNGSILCGTEIDIGAFTPNSTAEKRGLYLVFKNRGDGYTNPGQYSYTFPFGTYSSAGGGLGSNYYNKNAKAVHIESQERTATGEFCGWARGIQFAEYSLDSETDAAAPSSRAYPIGINFSDMHYYGGTDPVTAYNLEAAICFRDLQGIWWNRDPSNPYNPATKVKTQFNVFTGRWELTLAGSEKFGIDVNTGDIYSNGVPISSGVSLAGNNVWTGTNTYEDTVTMEDAGELVMGGTVIRGDFTNATLSDRCYFQTSTANSNTEIGAVPQGSSDVAGFYVCSDPSQVNGTVFRWSASSTSAQVACEPIGTGSVVPITFYNDNIEAFRISPTSKLLVGATTDPSTGSNTRFAGPLQIDNPVAFSVHRNNVTYNVANNTVVTIDFTVEVFDTNGSYDLAANTFTPPAGKYLLMGATCSALGPADMVTTTMIYKNGAQHKSGSFVSTSAVGLATGSAVCAIVEANGTDAFSLRVLQVNGAAATVTFVGLITDTYFQGYKIG